MAGPTYLDCNATTPVDVRVAEVVMRLMVEEFGNAGSRTHEFGARAKRAVQSAREQVAALVAARSEEVYFTSGATESNNLAILGLASSAAEAGRRHIISTQIEHKAVLEPLEALAKRGFEVQLLPPTRGGWIEPQVLKNSLRKDTALVSMMHVNNETGVIQPVEQIVAALRDHPSYLHIDAAQGFGKVPGLEDSRIDLLSISAHKVFGPKGVGALVARRRGYERVPIAPLMYGGGQERGLRPGTLPVALIAGFGLAAELAQSEYRDRALQVQRFRSELAAGLEPLAPVVNGDEDRLAPHVLNISFTGVDSEAAIVALKNLIALSNGSACTSQSYSPSHVLTAMALPADQIAGSLRLSWCHATPPVYWPQVVTRIQALRQTRSSVR